MEETTYKNRWHTLNIKLKNKYLEFLTDENIEKKTLYFNDGRTELFYHFSESQMALGLGYLDAKMHDDQSEREDDEL